MATQNNPKTLLKYDAAAVAIQAEDDETLANLQEFAKQLSRYVLLRMETRRKVTENNKQPQDAIVKTENGGKGNDETQQSAPHVPAAVSQNTQSTSCTTPRKRQANTVANTDLSPRTDNVEMPQDVIIKMEIGGKGKDETRQSAPDITAAATETTQSTTRTTPRKRQTNRVANTDVRPRKLARGYMGDLKSSSLARSVGRTRKILNRHLESLGLTAKFSNGVVSKRGNNGISHVTLSHKWNDMPLTTNETLEWWLGEGASRLELASPLDPSVSSQPKQGIPVFWACEQQQKTGGALCHYIGHFRCIRFEMHAVTVKDKPRQALVEFAFVKFDKTLANKLSLVPQGTS